jgi:hypothetical protein
MCELFVLLFELIGWLVGWEQLFNLFMGFVGSLVSLEHAYPIHGICWLIG